MGPEDRRCEGLAKERYKRVSQLDMVQSQHLEALGVEQVPDHAMLFDPVSKQTKEKKIFPLSVKYLLEKIGRQGLHSFCL